MENSLKEIKQILGEFHIKNEEDLFNMNSERLSEMYGNMKAVQEEYGLSDGQMEEILESIFK